MPVTPDARDHYLEALRGIARSKFLDTSQYTPLSQLRPPDRNRCWWLAINSRLRAACVFGVCVPADHLSLRRTVGVTSEQDDQRSGEVIEQLQNF
jgi:hypothetical protein